jgi:hypothetical protein
MLVLKLCFFGLLRFLVKNYIRFFIWYQNNLIYHYFDPNFHSIQRECWNHSLNNYAVLRKSDFILDSKLMPKLYNQMKVSEIFNIRKPSFSENRYNLQTANQYLKNKTIYSFWSKLFMNFNKQVENSIHLKIYRKNAINVNKNFLNRLIIRLN